jgi:glutathione S-transferase
MRTLYHLWLSPFCRKVRLLLKEKKLDFSLEIERPWERRKEFLSLNPANEVPVLIDLNGSVIPYHQAICEYVEEAYPEQKFMGETLVDRAEVRRLVGWFDEKFHQEVSQNLIHEKVWKRFSKEGAPNAGAIRAGLQHIHTHLDYISWLVDRRNWLAGHHFSLADMAAASHLSVIDYLGDVAWEKHPSAKEWYARIKSRPSFRPLLADHLPGMAPALHYTNLDF